MGKGSGWMDGWMDLEERMDGRMDGWGEMGWTDGESSMGMIWLGTSSCSRTIMSPPIDEG